MIWPNRECDNIVKTMVKDLKSNKEIQAALQKHTGFDITPGMVSGRVAVLGLAGVRGKRNAKIPPMRHMFQVRPSASAPTAARPKPPQRKPRKPQVRAVATPAPPPPRPAPRPAPAPRNDEPVLRGLSVRELELMGFAPEKVVIIRTTGVKAKVAKLTDEGLILEGHEHKGWFPARAVQIVSSV